MTKCLSIRQIVKDVPRQPLLLSSLNIARTHTMLYLVGLGLADEKDITVKGLEVVKRAARVYLEAYTAILLVDHHKLVCLDVTHTDHT